MEVATLIPTLALVTLLIATVAALISKKSTEERRKDPNAPKSTLAEDAPNTEAEKHS
jgi:hypothetical protein